MSDHQLAPGVTVEEVVRGQLAKALGGRRGMVEAAVPTIVFTVLWLTTRELQVALGVSVGVAVLLLVVRLVQRSTVQFVVNALFGIGIGWFFVRLAASRGGSEDEQALAYFLPGLLYNCGYAVVMAVTSCRRRCGWAAGAGRSTPTSRSPRSASSRSRWAGRCSWPRWRGCYGCSAATGRPWSRWPPEWCGRPQPPWVDGASSRSSSSSFSAGTTNSSSSPDSMGCSGLGV